MSNYHHDTIDFLWEREVEDVDFTAILKSKNPMNRKAAKILKSYRTRALAYEGWAYWRSTLPFLVLVVKVLRQPVFRRPESKSSKDIISPRSLFKHSSPQGTGKTMKALKKAGDTLGRGLELNSRTERLR